MPRTALDEVSETEPYRRMVRIIGNLEVSVEEAKDGALEFIAREVADAFLGLCEELKKITLEQRESGTTTIQI
jgi:hypothetical protein